MPRILVLNGPNLGILGLREPGVYGAGTLDELEAKMKELAAGLGHELEFLQSNHEGVLVDRLNACLTDGTAGVIFNPAAFTHYSVALHDAVKALTIPVIEVHISNPYKRDDFRHRSLIAPVATGQISGLGQTGYLAALFGLDRVLKEARDDGKES